MMKRYLLLIVLIGNGCKATMLPCRMFEAGIQAGKVAIPAALGIGTILAARNGLNWRQNPQPKPPSKAAQAKALASEMATKLSDMFTSCKKTVLNLTQKHPIACALGGLAGGVAVGSAAVAFFKRRLSRNRLHQQFTEILCPLRRQEEPTEGLLQALRQRAQQEAAQLQEGIQHLEGENARLRHQLSQKNPFAEMRLPSRQGTQEVAQLRQRVRQLEGEKARLRHQLSQRHPFAEMRLPSRQGTQEVAQLRQRVRQLEGEKAALAAAVKQSTALLKDGV